MPTARPLRRAFRALPARLLPARLLAAPVLAATILAATILAATVLAAGSARAEFAEINGTVNWLADGPRPPLNGTIHVRLVDVETETEGGIILASVVLSPEGASPLPFRLTYDRSLIRRSGGYRLFAEARLGTLLLMQSLRPAPALGPGAAESPEILLEAIQLGAKPGEASPEGRDWQVVSVLDEPVPASIRANLDLSNPGTAAGSAGCNSFTASYEISPEALILGELARTKRGCQSPRMKFERRLLRQLEKVRSWQIRGDRLFLADIAGGPLIELREN